MGLADLVNLNNYPTQQNFVTCVGRATPVKVYTVKEMPRRDLGACWTDRLDFISDDSAIVAVTLTK